MTPAEIAAKLTPAEWEELAECHYLDEHPESAGKRTFDLESWRSLDQLGCVHGYATIKSISGHDRFVTNLGREVLKLRPS